HPPDTHLYTLSLHDALPISSSSGKKPRPTTGRTPSTSKRFAEDRTPSISSDSPAPVKSMLTGSAIPIESNERHSFCQMRKSGRRSEEHTSELQSRFDLVCRL